MKDIADSKTTAENLPDITVHNFNSLKNRKMLEYVLIKNSSAVFTYKPENKGAVHGTVKLYDGSPAKGAIVKLYSRKNNSAAAEPVTFTFTDENGEFLFGIPPGEYLLEIYYYEQSQDI